MGGINITETKVQARFYLSKDETKKFEDGYFEVTGELLPSCVNKIRAVDTEKIIYLVPKDRIYNDEIRKDRKEYAKYILFFEGRFIIKRRNKKYILNHRVFII